MLQRETRKSWRRELPWMMHLPLSFIAWTVFNCAGSLGHEYYCSSAGSIEFHRNTSSRAVSWPAGGDFLANGEYCAVLSNQTLTILFRGKQIRQSPCQAMALLGWNGGRILLCCAGGPEWFDPRHGSSGTKLALDSVAIRSLAAGYLLLKGVNETEASYVAGNQVVRKWLVHGRIEHVERTFCQGQYVFTDIDSSDGKGFLWILDTRTGVERMLDTEGLACTYCGGFQKDGIFIARKTPTTDAKLAAWTSIDLVDLPTLKEHKVLRLAGQFDLVDTISPTGQILAKRPSNGVGPSDLVAIDPGSGRVEVVERGVYR